LADAREVFEMTDWLPPERSEHGPTNARPRRPRPMHADDHWLHVYWYEAPREDPAWPEVYTYTDAMSYAPGDEVRFHSSTTAPSWSLEIYRDGWRPERVHAAADLPGRFTPAPKDAYKAGCAWPVRHTWRLPADLRSGFYRVVSTCARPDGGRFMQHHFFVVRPTTATRRGRLLMLLPTATWTAYNDWGGANHYQGIDGPEGNLASPALSLERPWARGTVWLPEGAPRIMAEPAPELGGAPQYRFKEWAYANGFGLYYAACGWAQYDRHFVRWAEREGYALDMITQTDLQFRPELLTDYRCVVIVGHDEYWSWPMRAALEAFTENGGRVARFGANFLWQIRLEEAGRRQICHKFRAAAEDPVRGTADSARLTTLWEAPDVNWPGASTFGVNGVEGLYASWGGFLPRGQRGFTVYRPEHWAFRDTGLYYGDIFGAEARIFGYEVDGLDYTFRDGLPYPTGRDGAAADIAILAMAPAVLAEGDQHGDGFRPYLRDSDLVGITRIMTGGVTEEALQRYRYGAGMMVHMQRGKGEVLTAASCEWVMGLKRGDPFTEQITRNVLDRFLAD
jgi:hypothetical protein